MGLLDQAQAMMGTAGKHASNFGSSISGALGMGNNKNDEEQQQELPTGTASLAGDSAGVGPPVPGPSEPLSGGRRRRRTMRRGRKGKKAKRTMHRRKAKKSAKRGKKAKKSARRTRGKKHGKTHRRRR